MNAFKYILVMGWFLISMQVMAAETPLPLAESADQQLQQGLETIIAQQNLAAAVDSKELAVVLVIVTDPDKPHLAELNGDNMVYAASLPKIAILLGAAVEIDDGRLQLDDQLQIDLDNMIRYSCNACATKVLEQVGREELLEILQSPRLNFYDQHGNGGLWVGKDYAPSAAYHRDPLSGLSHGATAFQAARFYYKLQNGTLVSPQQTKLMFEALSHPGIKHKFVRGLKAYPNLELFRKSGSWRDYHADSALVRSKGLAYIMVALSHNPKGAVWIEKLAAPLHELAVAYNTRLHSTLARVTPPRVLP
ncbi:MAG: serine hydrolase [Lysobacterales bacterium]